MQTIFIQSFLGVLIIASLCTPEVPTQAKKSATVTLGNLRQTYNGSPRSVTTTTSAPGISSYKVTYNGSPIVPTAAGSYNVMATLMNANYQGSATSTLVIDKATATVTLGNLKQTYNSAPRSATPTTSATGINSYKITYNGSSIAPTAAGSYNVVATLENANFQGSATGTLVIAKATATAAVTLGGLRQTYNGTPRSVTPNTSATGISSYKVTYNGLSTAPTAPGSYNVVATLENANFQGSATGILVIEKANSTTVLTLSPAKAMVGQKVTLTATVKSTLNGALPSGNVTFQDGNKNIVNANNPVILKNDNGVATAVFSFTLTAGSHRFTAVYSGDTNFVVSTSPIVP